MKDQTPSHTSTLAWPKFVVFNTSKITAQHTVTRCFWRKVCSNIKDAVNDCFKSHTKCLGVMDPTGLDWQIFFFSEIFLPGKANTICFAYHQSWLPPPSMFHSGVPAQNLAYKRMIGGRNSKFRVIQPREGLVALVRTYWHLWFILNRKLPDRWTSTLQVQMGASIKDAYIANSLPKSASK